MKNLRELGGSPFPYIIQPQSPQPAPCLAKKRETRAQQTKIVSTRLEGFLDWARVVNDDPAEKEEMFSLAVGFTARMRKRPTTLEGEVTSSS